VLIDLCSAERLADASDGGQVHVIDHRHFNGGGR
jgi:hypothetical protein